MALLPPELAAAQEGTGSLLPAHDAAPVSYTHLALYLAGEPYKSGLKAQGCGKLKKAVFSIELDEDEEAE